MPNKEEPKGKPVGSRQRGANTRIGGMTTTRKVATGSKGKQFASAGRYTSLNDNGEIADNVEAGNRIRQLNSAARGMMDDPGSKIASLFADGGLGMADIADSQNIGYYSYEFPVDALELPASRAEELRFYRLAYDRDPIVGRAIDMHTELPLSKITLEKPKCSSPEYADFIFDWFQGLMNRTNMFQVLIEAVREYWTIGETFMFFEDLSDVEPCPMAKKVLEKGRQGKGADPGMESENAPLGGTADRILDFLQPDKRAAWVKKRASVIDQFKKAGINFDFNEDPESVGKEIKKHAKKIAKTAKLIGRDGAEDSHPIQITAAPGDPAPAAPPADAGAAPADPGAPMGAEGLDGVAGAEGAVPMPDGVGGDDLGGGGGAPIPMGGGGGGFGGDPTTPADMTGDVREAIAMGSSVTSQRELMEMRHYLTLLQRKQELLEELKEIREKKKEEMELFSHVTNPDYEGFDRIQILPPEQVELAAEGFMADEPTVYYKPPEKQKDMYLEDPDVDPEVKDKLTTDGKVGLNVNPFEGSYVIHFARKKSGYELHGRSILQRVMRTCIYREKLRQVQSTLASRNMTPKRLIVAPDIPPAEVMALRAHIDEAIADPDYSVVVNYECRWDEIGSEGRLLSLDAEWQHTNSDLAIGLGLSPEILIGEGMYSGNRIQLEIMNVSYVQFRDLLTNIIEDKVFKPMAMKKGFYEMDKYGRPRWIFPKVSFSRMALRDSGDLYDMLFNLYAKGSVPVDIILEFLNIDPEDCKRKLEDSLFTVNDAKFNELLSNIYNSLGQAVLDKSDVVKRVINGLTLNETDNAAEEGPEGSGEGMA